ncbi:hypothetical protein [Tamlana sp. I1]|uniref:hypothetical protein n=1 Tax=Tamlana sp. I1 TaxID=2762061 RepID=UPI0018903551|nr:hypothetical protein [Tamlana sp. I1]
MKKIILIAIAFIGLQGIAQEHKSERRNHNQKHHQKMDLTAEQMATLQTKKMTLALDLSNAQQVDIYKFNLENATKRKTIMAEHKAKKESGKAEKPSQEERYNRAVAKLDYQIASKAKMKTILKKDQFEKWEKMQKKRERKSDHHRKDRKGERRNS